MRRSLRRSLAPATRSSPSSPKDRMSSRSSRESAALPAPATLAIHLDLVGGSSGDMFVAAMTDALPALGDVVLAELRAVRPGDDAPPEFREVTRGGLRARGFGLARDAAASAPRTAAHAHRGTAHAQGKTAQVHGEEAHAPGDEGTAYSELRTRIERAPLAAATRMHALALLALLGEAEAHVHGIDIADVHFHELADWDSLLDIVAA